MWKTDQIIFIFIMSFVAFFILPAISAMSQERIAIIDTGLDFKLKSKVKLCDDGHYDFISDTESVGHDMNGHGSTISVIFQNELNVDHCLLIYKVFSKTATNISAKTAKAIVAAIKNKATYINYSLTGGRKDLVEAVLFTYANLKKVKTFAAAGNDGKDLDKKCDVEPPCANIENLNVVGAIDKSGKRKEYSNYGKVVTHWANDDGYSIQGTSLSVPRAIIHDIKVKRIKKAIGNETN